MGWDESRDAQRGVTKGSAQQQAPLLKLLKILANKSDCNGAQSQI